MDYLAVHYNSAHALCILYRPGGTCVTAYIIMLSLTAEVQVVAILIINFACHHVELWTLIIGLVSVL